jgi:hypothetical protein
MVPDGQACDDVCADDLVLAAKGASEAPTTTARRDIFMAVSPRFILYAPKTYDLRLA